MKDLSIDIETFSTVDIKKAGAYRYAEEAEVLLLSYSIDFAEPVCVDLMKDLHIPDFIAFALFDPSVKKSAHNAAFERAVLRQHFLRLLRKRAAKHQDIPPYSEATWGVIEQAQGYLHPSQWQCTQIMCARAGYPLSLDEASKALGTADKKDKRGLDLIRKFSVPCKPTKSNNFRTRNLPEHFPEDWQDFIAYCNQDVRTEQAIAKALSWIPVPEQEHEYWQENEQMNERGILVDTVLVESAIRIDADRRELLLAEASNLTGLDNPNSRAQLLQWLNEVSDEDEYETLRADDVKAIIASTDDELITRVMQLRQELSKNSIRKYDALMASVCLDGRAHGMIQFNGAPRTGRDAGRIIQPQNLPRMSIPDSLLDFVRTAIRDGDLGVISVLYDNIPDLLSQLIRTTLVAEEGKRLIVGDYNSIESRVLAWLAGEEWKLEVFRTHGKIYEATASRMFNVPIEMVTKDSEYRQNGKVAELALGFGGSVGAITTMDRGGSIADEVKPKLVTLYRASNPKTVKFWYALERAALLAIKNPHEIYKVGQGIAFCSKKNVLLMRLPSGRLLSYPRPFLTVNRWGNESIGFWGMDQKKGGKWSKQETYGGKLAENATQATARDVLMNGMHNLVTAGYSPILKVHDEVVTEEPYGFGTKQEMADLMCKKLPWMDGLPLAAEVFESVYYKK